MPNNPFSRRRLLQASAVGLGALVAPTAAACAPGTTPDTGSGNQPSGPAVELGPERAGIPYPDSYVGPRAYDRKPFSDGSKTFRVVVPQDATYVGDWATNKTTAEMERRTGLKIEYVSVLVTNTDGTTDLTKINAMLASGDLPDAFLGIDFTPAQLSLYGQQGLFVPLDDLITQYAPLTQKMMADYPGLRSLKASLDGKLYTMLGVNDCFHCRSSNGRAWINKEYLDQVGMPMPTTTEELRQVLLAFKEKNPSGKSGFLPFASSESTPIDTFFMNSFLYNPGGDQNGGWMRLTDGKVEFIPNTAEWREALKYLHQLGQDGTLTSAAFTMKDPELQQVGNKGLIGFARAYWWGSFFNPINLGLDEPWRDYVAVPPLKGPQGVQYAGWNYFLYANNHQGATLQITNKCGNPELLVQWVDYQLDLEATMWEYGGVKDSNWSFANEGDKGISGNQALWSTKVWPAPPPQSWAQYGAMYRSSDFRLSERVDPKAPTFETGLYEASKAYEPFAQPEEMQVPPLILDDADAAAAADTAVAIRNHVRTSLAKFSLGELDPNNDGDWTAYVETFNAMNIQAYLEIQQRAFEARPK